jgi:hypothetical protein
MRSGVLTCQRHLLDCWYPIALTNFGGRLLNMRGYGSFDAWYMKEYYEAYAIL